MADHEPDRSHILFRALLPDSTPCSQGRAPTSAPNQHKRCHSASDWLNGPLKEIDMTTTTEAKRNSMTELALYFLRLGFLGFGGPVALVGQMERELVNDKKWLTKDEMRESIAICQSLPGPLAIQVGIYIAWLRCGFWGAWVG